MAGALPAPSLASGTVIIGGVPVDYRGLSRSEALRLTGFVDDPGAAEVYLLTCGVGWSEAEAQQFRDEQNTADAGLLIDGILIASGLANGPDADPQ